MSSLFPSSFLQVYSSWLNAHYQLLATCVSFYILPPPSTNYSNNFFEKKVRSLAVIERERISLAFSSYSVEFDGTVYLLRKKQETYSTSILHQLVISCIDYSKDNNFVYYYEACIMCVCSCVRASLSSRQSQNNSLSCTHLYLMLTLPLWTMSHCIVPARRGGGGGEVGFLVE